MDAGLIALIVLAVFLFIVAALIACYLPSRRAAGGGRQRSPRGADSRRLLRRGGNRVTLNPRTTR